MYGFYDMSEALGGVNVCLNQAMGPATNGQTGDGYDSGTEPDGTFISSYTGINLHAGWNYNIKGKQALAFVRQRHGLPGGDLDRIKRQQYFLSALFRKVETAGTLTDVPKLQKLLKAVGKSLVVDSSMQGTGLLKFAEQMSTLSSGGLKFYTVPNLGNGTENGSAVIEPDPLAMPAFVQFRLLGPSDAYTNAKAELSRDVTVAVQSENVNADGAAATAAATLTTLGFKATGTEVNAKTSLTRIEYPPGQERAAKTLAHQLPGVTVQATTTVHQVTLVLGSDGLMPHLPAKKVSSTKTATAPPTTKPGATASNAGLKPSTSTTTKNNPSAGLGCIN